MIRLDARSPPARAVGWDRGSSMLALVISLGLHSAALAGFVLFREVKPPEPYTVIAVELVEAGDVVSSSGADAGSMPGMEQLADDSAQYEMPDAFEALLKNGGSPVKKTAKPIRNSAHAPMPETSSYLRGTAPPAPAEQPAPILIAVVPDATAETMLPVPPAPRRKPTAPKPSAGPKPSKIRIEEKLAEIKLGSLQSASQKSTREVTQSDRDQATVRRQQIATLNQEKHLTRSLGDSPGVVPRYAGGGLSNAAPRYPYLARRRGQEGRVVVRVQVSAAGDAAAVSIRRSSGYRLLDEAAVKAVKTWRFAPAKRGGFSVAGSVDVPVSFKLTD